MPSNGPLFLSVFLVSSGMERGRDLVMLIHKHPAGPSLGGKSRATLDGSTPGVSFSL